MSADVQAALEQLVGREAISRRPVEDLWPLHLMQARTKGQPAAVLVARPSSYEQVSRLLAWANEAGRVVIPMGAATGVCGALEPHGDQVVLDLGGLDRLVEVNEHDLTCRAQAGLIGLRLEEEVQRRGLTLGHYPSSLPVSTIGGLVSTRSSGQQSTLFGNIEDILLGVVVALADGTVLPLRPGPRSAVGPALHQLFVGAGGGLGVILECELRLQRLPPRVIGRGYQFESVPAGLEGMRAVMQAGLKPLVMRLYDPEDTAFQALGIQGCLLVVAFAGEDEVAAAGADAAARLLDGAQALGEDPWEHWLAHRFDLSVDRLRQFLEPAGSFVDTIELAATWSRLPELYASVKEILGRAGLALCHFSHAYPQGCCTYFTFAGSAPSEAAAVAAYEQAWTDTMHSALELGATVSHHHGVGLLRARWARNEMQEWGNVWEAVRAGLDPKRTLNPNALGG